MRVPMRRVEYLLRLCPPPCHTLAHLYFLCAAGAGATAISGAIYGGTM